MYRYVTLFLVLIALVGCSDSNDLFRENQGFQTMIDGDQLTVKSSFRVPVYYFAVESEWNTRINWAPVSKDDNRIAPFRSKTFSLKELGVKEKGEHIIFYYWTPKEPETEDIKNIDIVVR